MKKIFLIALTCVNLYVCAAENSEAHVPTLTETAQEKTARERATRKYLMREKNRIREFRAVQQRVTQELPSPKEEDESSPSQETTQETQIIAE